jgi:hypothetical protein
LPITLNSYILRQILNNYEILQIMRQILNNCEILHGTPVSLSLARPTSLGYLSLTILGTGYSSLTNFAAARCQSHYLCPQGPILSLSVSLSLAPYNIVGYHPEAGQLGFAPRLSVLKRMGHNGFITLDCWVMGQDKGAARNANLNP